MLSSLLPLLAVILIFLALLPSVVKFLISLIDPLHIPWGDHGLIRLLWLAPAHTLRTLLLLLLCLSAIGLGYFRWDLSNGASRASCRLLFLEYGDIKFVFGIFIDVSEVLGNAIIRSEVLLCEIHCFFVAQDGSRVRPQEFLLDSHVVIGDGKHSCAVLGVLISGGEFLLLLLHGVRV